MYRTSQWILVRRADSVSDHGSRCTVPRIRIRIVGAFSTMNFSQLFLAALLPFCFYWWIAQSGPIVASIFTRIRSAFKR
jgi:hypothetical protein